MSPATCLSLHFAARPNTSRSGFLPSLQSEVGYPWLGREMGKAAAGGAPRGTCFLPPRPPLRALRSGSCAAAEIACGPGKLEERGAGGSPARRGGLADPGWEPRYGTSACPLRGSAHLRGSCLQPRCSSIPAPGAQRGNTIRRLSLEEMRRGKLVGAHPKARILRGR